MRYRGLRRGQAAPEAGGALLLGSSGLGLVDWAKVFGRVAPLYLEIGAGKGDFIIAAAKRLPDIDFVGVERVLPILRVAADKYERLPARAGQNLRLMCLDAGDMEQCFVCGSVSRIYMNFSDPWPKNRHRARRLTTADKLGVYSRLLIPGGQVHLKTDQEDFFEYSLAGFVREGWSVGEICRDLHGSGFEGNIMTEYERRFSQQGRCICRLVAYKSGQSLQSDQGSGAWR